jgi:tetratricopeptide (TPR) repeat protein
MAKHAPDLFHNRSVTQDFLVSHTDETTDEGIAAADVAERNRSATARSPQRSGMLDRQGLVEAIDAHMASAAALCVMAISIEHSAATPSGEDRQTASTADPVPLLATRYRGHGGVWARIGQGRFACALTDRSAVEGQALAEELLKAFSETANFKITIGLAAYPTINYSRRQIVENAEKALDHGAFFGPGSITGFDAVSLNISGDRHYQAGDVKGAIDEFKRGLLIDPTNANLHNSLGVCYGVLKDYENALTAFENANWLAPEEVMAIYNKGYILLQKGLPDQALDCFLEANGREPDVFEVLFHIGQIYMEMDQADRARAYLEAATRANNRSGAAFKSLGACLDKLGLTKEAIQAYKSAVKVNPDDAQSLAMLGRLYTERGESLDVAVVLCAQSVRLAPENGLYQHHLGLVYLNQGKLEEALSAFESAVALGHDSKSQVEETQNRLMAAKAS